MDPEEKASELVESSDERIDSSDDNSTNDNSVDNETMSAESENGVPVAELADIGTAASDADDANADVVTASVAPVQVNYLSRALTAPPMASQFQNLSANGGAVAAITLGVMVIIGSVLTDWAIVNGLLGMLMGLWGLSSQMKRTAIIGIAMCFFGLGLCYLL